MPALLANGSVWKTLSLKNFCKDHCVSSDISHSKPPEVCAGTLCRKTVKSLSLFELLCNLGSPSVPEKRRHTSGLAWQKIKLGILTMAL